MKRLLIALGLVATFAGSAFAQTTAHFVQWDPNPISDNVLYYTVTFDAATGASVSPTVDATCGCISWALPNPLANGSHTVTVSATNTWGTSSATTLTFNVAGPGTVKNVRIK